MNILVSSCLCGVNCKYNGGNNEDKRIIKLMDTHTVICVCPEVLGGLSIPRPPSEIKGDRVITKDGEDVTEAFYKGAGLALEAAEKYNVDIAILKANSPSCGCGKVYDGTFSKTLVDGDGIFARMLKEKNIKVYNENSDLSI